MSNVRFAIAGLAFFTSMLLSPIAGAVPASESLCPAVFMTAKNGADSAGVLETAINERKAAREATRAKIDQEIEKLEGLDPKLVAEVTSTVVAERAIKKMFPGERIEAVGRLAEVLREFKEFKSLSVVSQEQLAKLLLQGNRDAVVGMFGTKHLLYEAAAFRDRSAPYAASLALIQSINSRGQLEDKVIASMSSLIAAKGAKDLTELKERRAKLEAQVLAQKFIPPHVIAEVIAIASEYGRREAGVPSIISGTALATAKWNQLLKEDEFFTTTLSSEDLKSVGTGWQRATTPLAVIWMFGSSSKAAPETLFLRIRDLGEVQAALIALGVPPTN